MKNKNVLSTVLAALLIPFAASAWSAGVCDYYVDAENGNDNYTGRATAYDGTDGPWKTLYTVISRSGAFVGGDRICFRNGQRFYYRNNGWLRSSGDPVNGPIV